MVTRLGMCLQWSNILALLVASSLAGSAALVMADAGAAQTSRARIPVAFVYENICVPYAGDDDDVGDEGEFVDFAGWLLEFTHEVTDGAGAPHLVARYQLQGVVGIGRASGATYRYVGGNLVAESGTGAPGSQAIVAHFRFVGPGPGSNFVVFGRFHVTTNASGERVAETSVSGISCQ